MARLARGYEVGRSQTPVFDSQRGSVSSLFFLGLANDLHRTARCSFQRMARERIFTDACSHVGRVCSNSSAASQLQHNNQLALSSNRLACACATCSFILHALANVEAQG